MTAPARPGARPRGRQGSLDERPGATRPLAVTGAMAACVAMVTGLVILIPLVLDGNPSDTPAAVGIYQFLDANAQVQYGPLAAYSILFSIPVLILYLISSRWLQGGFAFAGGIKG